MNRFAYILALIALIAFQGCVRHRAPMAKSEAQLQAQKADAIAKMSTQEIMDKVAASGTPGEAHTNLQPLVGIWSTEVKWWKSPTEKPEISKGVANHQWVLGKRFLKEEFKGKFAGKPYQGVGTLGYDNVKKEYVSTWIDSMSTGIMTSEGTYDPNSKTIEMLGKFSCPLTGTELRNRSVTRILGNKEHVLEIYELGPDGKEYKSMEITYKRKA